MWTTSVRFLLLLWLIYCVDSYLQNLAGARFLASNMHNRTSAVVLPGGAWKSKLSTSAKARAPFSAVGLHESTSKYPCFYAESILPASSSLNSQKPLTSALVALVSPRPITCAPIRSSASQFRLRPHTPPLVSFPMRRPQSPPKSFGNPLQVRSACSDWNFQGHLSN